MWMALNHRVAEYRHLLNSLPKRVALVIVIEALEGKTDLDAEQRLIDSDPALSDGVSKGLPGDWK